MKKVKSRLEVFKNNASVGVRNWPVDVNWREMVDGNTECGVSQRKVLEMKQRLSKKSN